MIIVVSPHARHYKLIQDGIMTLGFAMLVSYYYTIPTNSAISSAFHKEDFISLLIFCLANTTDGQYSRVGRFSTIPYFLDKVLM